MATSLQVMALTSREGVYVVQQHVPDPLLTDDGRKAHIKFYLLLLCEARASLAQPTRRRRLLPALPPSPSALPLSLPFRPPVRPPVLASRFESHLSVTS